MNFSAGNQAVVASLQKVGGCKHAKIYIRAHRRRYSRQDGQPKGDGPTENKCTWVVRCTHG